MFDTDLVNIPQDPPEFLVREAEWAEREKIEYEEMKHRHGVEALTSPKALKEHLKDTQIPMYQLYSFCHDGPLLSPKSKFTKLSIVKQEN